MQFGYNKRTGKRKDYKYWYFDDKTKMYYECIKPSDYIVGLFPRNKNHPPKNRIMNCPWINIHTGNHELIETKDGVLFNKGGIIDKKEIDYFENFHFISLINELINEITPRTSITVKVINKWHQRFLGQLYTWAGKYRTVDVSKYGFRWPSYNTIPNAMNNLNRFLISSTPITSNELEEILNIVSKIMGELLFIHPFREGNGRITKLIGVILLFQKNYPILNFTNTSDTEWINASLDAYAQDYTAIKGILRNALNEN